MSSCFTSVSDGMFGSSYLFGAKVQIYFGLSKDLRKKSRKSNPDLLSVVSRSSPGGIRQGIRERKDTAILTKVLNIKKRHSCERLCIPYYI